MSGRSARLRLQLQGFGEPSTSGDGISDDVAAQILDPVARRVYEIKREHGLESDTFTEPIAPPLGDEDWPDDR